MKLRDLKHERTKNAIELGAELVKRQARLDGLRFDLVQGKVKNIREIRFLRRSIAQLATLLAESRVSASASASSLSLRATADKPADESTT